MSAKVKKISTGYSPRPLQARLHSNLKRFNVLVMHRRFGKTVFSINETLDRALRNPLKNPQYAYLAPTYGQAKRVAWDYFKQYAASIPGAIINEAELRIDIPRPALGDRIRFMLLGAENPMALKGLYLDGVILDEYAEMNPSAWSEVIRPALSDRKGWAIFIGTPKGQNNFYELFEYAKSSEDPEWFAALYKASETGIIDQGEIESARKQMTEEEFEQEFECSFSAGLVGAYFAKELALAEKENRVTRVPYDKMIPVDVYFDLGWNDTTAVWFIQSHRLEHRLIDHYETSGTDLPTIVRDVKNRGYNLDYWILPHDGQNKSVLTGKSARDILYSLGIKRVRVVPRVQYKRDSINAARMIFNKCVFDAAKCKQGLKALANYQRKWDAKNNVFQDTPLHNWASNSADAYQTFAMGVREDSSVIEIGGRFYDGRQPLQAEMDYDVYA